MGVLCPEGVDDPGSEEDGRHSEEPEYLPAAPGIGGLVQLEGKDEGREGTDHQGGGKEVELVPFAMPCLSRMKVWHLGDDEPEGNEADRDIDIEDPPPALDGRKPGPGIVGEEAADQGAQDARQAKDRPEDTGDLAPLARRIEVGDDDEGQCEDARATESLKCPKQDQLVHSVADEREAAPLPGQAAERRGGQKDRDARDLKKTPGKDVGQLAVDRHEEGRDQEVGGGHPGETFQPMQLRDDAWHGCRDDGLIEGTEEHGQGNSEDGVESAS
jgi:hypothetical protein